MGAAELRWTTPQSLGTGGADGWRVDLLWVRLRDLPPQVDWACDLLNTVEMERRAAYRTVIDRVRFEAGVALARLGVAERDGRHPRSLTLDRTCADCGAPHGKVRIEGGPHVSTSHSGEIVSVAFCDRGLVGVDVEKVRGDLDLPSMKPVVLHRSELPGVRTAEDFTRVWTRKEAVVKCTGDGLRAPLREVLVTPPHRPPEVLSYCGVDRPDISLADLGELGSPGHLATVAVLSADPPSVRSAEAVGLINRWLSSAS